MRTKLNDSLIENSIIAVSSSHITIIIIIMIDSLSQTDLMLLISIPSCILISEYIDHKCFIINL